jgi:hypothetical protein
MTFCTDTDLLHWEPTLFADAAFASQTLISGADGALAGTAFTISSGSFAAAHVTPGGVIALTGGTSGCYPIVSVDGATELTLSTMYDGLLPLGETSSGASPVGTATGLAYAVRTFWPQRQVVSELLLQAAGVDPVRQTADAILNPTALRKACALGSIQMIYSALAAAASAPGVYEVRADLYERLYRRSLRSARVEIDLDGDGQANCVRTLNVLELQRI